MVTLSLFDTLLSLHSENLMLELLLKFLVPCKHIPISHRHKVNKVDGYAMAVVHFLELAPEVMKHACDSAAQRQIQPISKTIGANWNHYGLHTGDSLYANYRAYLFDARHKITQCYRACSQWSAPYRLQQNQATSKRSEKTMELIRNFLSEFSSNDGNGYQVNDAERSGKQLDSLQSLGESSGYESFKYRLEDDEDGAGETTSHETDQRRRTDCWKLSSRRQETEIEFDFSEDLFTQGTVTLGKLKIRLQIGNMLSLLLCF